MVHIICNRKQRDAEARNGDLGPVSGKSRELFGPEKPFVIVRPACSVKLVFSYVVKGIKTKITAKFLASRRLCFEDTKRIMSPEIRPKSFGTFEKQAPGACFSKVPKFFGPISGTTIPFISSQLSNGVNGRHDKKIDMVKL